MTETQKTDWYMFYAKPGREFDVAREIEDMGLDVICERKLEFKRRGRDRYPTPKDIPALPGYIFAEVPAAYFANVAIIKHLSRTAMPVCEGDLKIVREFQTTAQRLYEAQDRKRRAGEVLSEFHEGQAVKLVDDAMAGIVLKFRERVQKAHDPYPKLKLEGEAMGRVITIEADPLDVRAAD